MGVLGVLRSEVLAGGSALRRFAARCTGFSVSDCVALRPHRVASRCIAARRSARAESQRSAYMPRVTDVASVGATPVKVQHAA